MEAKGQVNTCLESVGAMRWRSNHSSSSSGLANREEWLHSGLPFTADFSKGSVWPTHGHGYSEEARSCMGAWCIC
jgi:hypothetical protein